MKRITRHIQRCRSFSDGGAPRIMYAKAWQISKVQARSRDITNQPRSSSNYENSDQKTMTADLKTNKDTETNTTSEVEKFRNRRKQNFYLFSLCSISLLVKVRFDIALRGPRALIKQKAI